MPWEHISIKFASTKHRFHKGFFSRSQYVHVCLNQKLFFATSGVWEQQNVIPYITWGLRCQKQVSHTGISNCIPRCNYLSLPEMPDFGTYLRQGWVITSHRMMWDGISYPCSIYLLLAPKSSYQICIHSLVIGHVLARWYGLFTIDFGGYFVDTFIDRSTLVQVMALCRKTNVAPDLRRHMESLGHSGLNGPVNYTKIRKTWIRYGWGQCWFILLGFY